MFRKFIDSIMVTRRFNVAMRIVNGFKMNETTYPVRITKNQMDMLHWCACMGIENDTDLGEYCCPSESRT